MNDSTVFSSVPHWRFYGIDDLGLDPAMMMPDRLIPPASWVGHIPFASWIVAAARPRLFVELGVHTGNSYCAVAQATARFNAGARCLGIDHWQGDTHAGATHAGTYGDNVYHELKAWHDPRFQGFSSLMRMSFEDALPYVEDGTVDLLHIDGLHTYDAVNADFTSWHRKLSDRSVVLLHDVTVYRENFGVWRLWRELKEQFPAFQFLHCNGLGVVYTGTRPLSEQPALNALLSAARTEVGLAKIHEYFSRIGRWHSDRLYYGQIVAPELERLRRECTHHNRNLCAERDALLPRARAWDQWASLFAAVPMHPQVVAEGIRRLCNNKSRQAELDRLLLRQTFKQLSTGAPLSGRLVGLAHEIARRGAQLMGLSLPVKVASVACIERSGLFQEREYALTDAARAQGRDPLEHYLSVGEGLRVAPSRGFDPNYYARCYPDIAASGFGLLRHYCVYGQHEGRHALPPHCRLTLPKLPPAAANRPRVMLLLHNASRDKTSLLGWTLARALSDVVDLVVTLQEGGVLRTMFLGLKATVIDLAPESAITPVDADALMRHMVEVTCPAYVIVNTLDAHIFVPSLVKSRIGVVSLAYASLATLGSSVSVSEALQDMLFWSHRVVFPTQRVAESFLRSKQASLFRNRFRVLPPGVAPMPAEMVALTGTQRSYDTPHLLRPMGCEDDFIVVGVGDAKVDDDVELFFAMAASAERQRQELGHKRHLRFVWIRDEALADDARKLNVARDYIAAAGLKDICEILEPIDIKIVYHHANALALTSRLEALPDAAMGALAVGMPTFCFEQTNVVADLLVQSETTRFLVAPYLDIAEMGRVVSALAADPERADRTFVAIQELAAQTLDMSAYVLSLLRLGEEAAAEAAAVQQDLDDLLACKGHELLASSILTSMERPDSPREDMAAHYLTLYRIASARDNPPSSITTLRPFPGLNPDIYREDAMDNKETRDPFTHWLLAKRPKGRWTYPSVDLSQASPTCERSEPRVLLHGHLYYEDLAGDLRSRLECNVMRPDLVLTTPNRERVSVLREAFADYKGAVDIKVIENRGRDIGAFLSGLDASKLDQYDIIGHVHSKKTPNLPSNMGDSWRNELWTQVIGDDTHPTVDICIATLMADAKLGLIFPDDPELYGWGDNRAIASQLLLRMGYPKAPPTHFEFPAGTMFWARSGGLRALFSLGLTWDDYPAEPIPADGTVLHALERLLPFSAELAGLSFATCHLGVRDCKIRCNPRRLTTFIDALNTKPPRLSLPNWVT